MDTTVFFMVWKNEFGSLAIDTSEHGHRDSELLATFASCQEAEDFVENYIA